MKILFSVIHPAHVHLFRNAIKILKERGHEIKVTSVDKEITAYLLNAYGIEHDSLGVYRKSFIGKAFETLRIEKNLYKISRKFKVEILIGAPGNIYVAHVAKLLNKPSIIFDDSEPTKIHRLLVDPFATVICTPSCFKKDLGKKQVRYNGYHELAYLHPNHFKPDSEVLNELKLSKDDKFIILRFVAWSATHDIGQKGFDSESKIKLVKELEKYAKVFITSESKLDENLEKYKISISPEKIHDVLYYAKLFIGDGATMINEASILGTPSIHISSFAETMGYLIEVEREYKLMYSFKNPDDGKNKAFELLKTPDIKHEWAKKRENLLNEKIDVTKFMVNFIENYPESFYEYEKFKI